MSETRPIRILYMEDDPGLARLFQTKLERAGYMVDIARDGAEGLDMVEAGFYDLVAVDQAMPRYEGLEVIRILASRGPLPPTIMVTAAGSEHVAVEAMRLGVSDYLVKDAEAKYLDLLDPVIQHILRQHQLIEEKQRAEEALRESEARYRGLFDGVPVGLYQSTPDGDLIDANPALMEMLGYPDEETLLAANVAQFYVDPDDRRRWRELMDRSGVVRAFEMRLRRYDGTSIWARDTARATRSPDDRVLYYEGSLEDITARKRAEEALRERAAELERRNEELDAFAHTVAHDLKGPLSPLIGFAHVLTQASDRLSEGQTHEIYQTIARSSRKMANIIDELLLLSSVRTMEEVETGPLDMARVVAQAQARLAHFAEERQAEILLPEAWPVAVGYGPWIEEVWVNYLSNAIKYGGEPPRVELGAAVPDVATGGVRFWVQDNGAGLTPEEQARLFTPFTRLDQTRATGHGLGLSIVRRIVERLGGQVDVDSTPGEGSVFGFTLPSDPTAP